MDITNTLLSIENKVPVKGKAVMSKLDFGDFPDKENSSIYKMVKENYETFWEENKGGEFGEMTVDLVRAVKRSIFGTSKTKNQEEPLDVLIQTFRFIVEKMCGLTVEDFASIYSTKTNKKIHVENLARKISELVDDDIKERCLFDQKRIVFATVYPEYYNEKFSEFEPMEIFYAKGDLKGALVRAAKICNPDAGVETGLQNNDGTFKKVNVRNGVKKTYGKFVDKILFDAIEKVFDASKCDEDELRDDGFPKDDTYKRMEWFGYFKNWKNISEKNMPGCIAIIKERGCYACPLDFYFLNMPPEKQLEYVDDFMYIRNKANIPQEPMLNRLYMIYKENQAEIENYIINRDID